MVSCEVIHSGNKHGAALYPLLCDIELTLSYFAFTTQPNTQKGYEPSGTTLVSIFFCSVSAKYSFEVNTDSSGFRAVNYLITLDTQIN